MVQRIPTPICLQRHVTDWSAGVLKPPTFRKLTVPGVALILFIPLPLAPASWIVLVASSLGASHGHCLARSAGRSWQRRGRGEDCAWACCFIQHGRVAILAALSGCMGYIQELITCPDASPPVQKNGLCKLHNVPGGDWDGNSGPITDECAQVPDDTHIPWHVAVGLCSGLQPRTATWLLYPRTFQHGGSGGRAERGPAQDTLSVLGSLSA